MELVTGSRKIALEENFPPDNGAPYNCPQGKLPPHHKTSPENSCPYSSNFLSKSTMSELRKTMNCQRVCTLIKESFYQKLFLKAAN